ncbi:hypothetical protein M407DRAFT_25607 [Tulasnella calospora MUT 4182]|uniref:Phospholipid-transporting ATPase n=1 Tax=Tulasnella calospora MUT 4182 TaxID=1051891 RepID=A0A0C3QFV1_9AGAM|nr:hypothetical protein M407DRAFT_25607 [Tulasnella calospora MUT 4182]
MAPASHPPQRHRKRNNWFTRLTDWKIEDLFKRKRPPPIPRTVFVNENLPEDAYEKGKVKTSWIYPTNQVLTSKYTVITFLPKNLLEQFRRIANIFFAGIAILQFFSAFSTISPGLVVLPLLVVLLATGIKDGYEDIKRHQSDRAVNHAKVWRLHGADWVNPNVTGPKQKSYSFTFVQKLFRRSRSHTVHEHEEKPVPDTAPQVAVDHDDNNEPDNPRFLETSHHLDETKAHWKRTLWEDVAVGDVVMLRADDAIPADILICATSEEENVAFVETKNLDGETNLKSRHAVPSLAGLRTPSDVAGTAFHIDMEAPQPNMYQIHGAVIVDDDKQPVDGLTVLLRGTILRNTRWCIGIVLYTGEDTKIVMNSGATPSKRSRVERGMNPQVFVNLSLLAVMAVVCAIVDSILEQRGHDNGAPWEWGTDRSDDNPRVNGGITFGNALITFQNVVPISLYISIEFVRTCQALFIYFDKDIWYEKTDQPTLARSWNLADDLGQIEYVFSDKTGTLTQNAMIFRQCSIGGKIYKGDSTEDEPVDVDEAAQEDAVAPAKETQTGSSDETTAPQTAPKISPHIRFHDETLEQDLLHGDSQEHSRTLHGFFATLSLCHTVLASYDPDTGMITYKAQSPDEAALVQAAADVGFIFRGRERETLRLQTPFLDHLEEYELLNILDFTSARKRMSVIVRKLEEGDGRIFLLCKGADNVIFDRLKQSTGNEQLKTKTGEDLDLFASDGLRTLCLAYKVIPEDEYNAWADRYHDATVALEDRDDKIEAVSNEIEQNLRLLGATAIEDKLQDGVPEAIADLKRAGIKVWVATGDKLETAIAIGHSTNLIQPQSNVIIVRGGTYGTTKSAYNQLADAVDRFFPESNIMDSPLVHPPDDEKAPSERFSLRRMPTGASSLVGSRNGERPGGFVLVIDGVALEHAMEEEFTKELLLQLGIRCEAVICCRVSPKQKAQIVRLVKDGMDVVTLAIGDGANDVSMIQAADVGVGISGEEGLQAVNSSDYAIAQFRFLTRLLFVHGHWSYARNGNMIVNFFYKNIVCIGVLWWFQIYCQFSTTYVFEYTYLLFWNVFWSLAPVIAIGLFDRIIDDDILMTLPELYRYGRERTHFGLKRFIIYMLDGVMQSAIIFFVIYYTYDTTSARNDGWGVYQYEMATTVVVATATVVNLVNGLNTAAWTGWVFFSVSIGIILIWAYTAIYPEISPGWFVTDAYGDNQFTFPSAYFWLGIIFVVLISMLPRYVLKSYKFIYLPNDIDILRSLRSIDPKHDIAHDPAIVGNLDRPGEEVDDDRLTMTETRQSEDGRASLPPRRSLQGRPSYQANRQSMEGGAARANPSQVDMSTGREGTSRGFDFSTEEGGYAMRRVQTHLSERHVSRVSLPAAVEARTPKRRQVSMNIFSSLRRPKGRSQTTPASAPPTDKKPPPPSPPPAPEK